KVYDYLEGQILGGELPVGARLPTEPELSKGFGVSRTVVREAIQKLKAQGLVVSKVGNGSFVASDQMAQIKKAFSHYRQIYANKRAILDYVKLRTIIELECMNIVGRERNPACLRELDAIVDKMKDPQISFEEFEQLDMSFHLTMAANSGNIMFQAILEPLKEFSTRSGLLERQRTVFTERRQPLWEEHRKLLDLIKAGRVEEAQAYFREQMKHTLDTFEAITAPAK
ncbi:MAG: FadR family transcriptional regulator, partial [Cephaloticoccus sp.]|nr:FadR family transcriptional regulator [Cephaloticoccus sp.]